MESIILAGGLGTRLRGVIGAAPKCMAPVAGKPFLHYIFRYLESCGCTRVVLSLGYQHEAVLQWLDASPRGSFSVEWVVEEEPLGTGGGIQLALSECREEEVCILNGDTLFPVNLQAMLELHRQRRPETTIALKAMRDFDRYGIVQTNADDVITAFEEKAPRPEGRINGGVYVINRAAFRNRSLPQKFSFEKDYLERFVGEQKFIGWESEAYFIDIGVPQDYEQAQHDFQTIFTA